MLTYAEVQSVKQGSTMQPQELNMAPAVTGYQLFLFITFGDGKINKELVEGVVVRSMTP